MFSQRCKALWSFLPLSFFTRWTLVNFSVASTALRVSGMLAGFIVLKWVAPEDIGIWQSLLLIQTYSLIFEAGTVKGLSRELPYRLGGQDSTAIEIVSTAQAVTAFGAALLFFGGVCTLFVLSIEPRMRFVMAAVLFGSAGNLYNGYLVVLFNATRSFQQLAKIRLVLTIGTIVTLPIVYFFKFEGLAIRFLIMMGSTMLLTHYWRPIRVPLKFSWNHLAILLRVGIPIFCFSYIIGVSMTFPRIILLERGGTHLVGLFAPAAAALGLFSILPAVIGQYFAPRMSFRFGETREPESLWPMAWKVSITTLALSAPIAVIAFVFLPALVNTFIPKYVVAIPAIKWSIGSGLFASVTISVSVFRSLKAWRWMTVYTIIRVSASYLIPFFLVHAINDTLEAVAAGYMIAELLNFGTAMLCIYFATHSIRYAEYQSTCG